MCHVPAIRAASAPFRGSKLKFADVDPALVAEAMRPGSRLVARIRFTGAEKGPNPVWSAVRS